MGKKEKENPHWSKPTLRHFDGERFYSTGHRHRLKREAKKEAEQMRRLGHKARVVPRKSMFGGRKEYDVVRDKY